MKRSKAVEFLLGVFLIVTTALIWVISGGLIQHIFHNLSYQKPFFLTYFANSLFAVYLLGFFFMRSWWKGINYKEPSLSLFDQNLEDDDKKDSTIIECDCFDIVHTKHIFATSILLCPLWFATFYFYVRYFYYLFFSKCNIF